MGDSVVTGRAWRWGIGQQEGQREASGIGMLTKRGFRDAFLAKGGEKG